MNMTPSFPAIDADLPVLLRQLKAQQQAGSAAGAVAILQALGAARWIAPSTLIGAVLIGGVELAQLLLTAHAPAATAAQRAEALRLALAGFVETGAAPGHADALARWLSEGLDLALDGASLPDRLRVEFLAHHGGAEQLPEVVQLALRQLQWAPALAALTRLREGQQGQVHRQLHGLGAMCLHHLGRYEEASRWAAEGLGPDARLLAIPPVREESELLRRWGGAGKPVVTILCTTYNHERYVDEAMRGFLSQDCDHPFEIVVHDDASTDRTAELIRGWQRRYPNLIRPILQTENQKSKGGMRHFHLALAQARGEFIAICEGDDFWTDPGKLQRQVSFLIEHPQFSCSAHNYRLFTESTLEVRPWSELGRDFIVTQEQMMSNQVLIWGLTLVFRNSFSALPPERFQAAFGDQLLVSYLGTLGPCAYLETLMGAVRRVNAFSSWMPLPDAEKERRRVQTWLAIAQMQQRLGNSGAARELRAKVQASALDPAIKAELLAQASRHRAPAESF
ncbi:MAG: glycosyltransferase [Comamonadaceae bacterium]|nr:glycosyltransferase [Comamonadaceae bacterium]